MGMRFLPALSLGLILLPAHAVFGAADDDMAQAKTYLKEQLKQINVRFPFQDWENQLNRCKISVDEAKGRLTNGDGSFNRDGYATLDPIVKDMADLLKHKADADKLIKELYVSTLVVRIDDMFHRDGKHWSPDAKLAFQRALMPYEAGSIRPKTAFVNDCAVLDREFRRVQTNWLYSFSQDFLGRRVEEHLRTYNFAKIEALYDDYSLQLDYWTKELHSNPAQTAAQLQALTKKFEDNKGWLRQNLEQLLEVLNTDMLFSDLLEYARKQKVDFNLEVEEKIEASLKDRNQATLAPIYQRISLWKNFAGNLRDKVAMARNEDEGQRARAVASAQAERKRMEEERQRVAARAEEERRQVELERQQALAKAEEERRQAEANEERERKRLQALAEAQAEEERKEALSREEAEKRERDRQAKLEADRKERERREQERQARLENERQERERLEQERLARLENERKEQEQREQEQLAKQEAERAEQERKEKERLAALEEEQKRQEQEQKEKFKQTLNDLKTFTFDKSENAVAIDDDSKKALSTKTGFLKTSYVSSGSKTLKVDKSKFSDTLALVQKFTVEEGQVDFSKMSLQERSNQSAYTYASPAGRTSQGDLDNFVAEVALGSFSTYYSFLSYVTPSRWTPGRPVAWMADRDHAKAVQDREFSYVDLVVDAHRKRSGGSSKGEATVNLPANMIVIFDAQGAIIRFQSFADVSQISIHHGDLAGGKLYYKFLNYSADRQNIYLNGIDAETKVAVPAEKS